MTRDSVRVIVIIIRLYLVYGIHLSPLWYWLPIDWIGTNTESWYGDQKGVWLGESFLLGLSNLNRWHEGIRGFDFPYWIDRKEFIEGYRKTFIARFGRALQGHGNCSLKVVSESPFIVTIVVTYSDKLNLWNFT